MSLYTFAGEHCGDRGQPIVGRFIDFRTGEEKVMEYPYAKTIS